MCFSGDNKRINIKWKDRRDKIGKQKVGVKGCMLARAAQTWVPYDVPLRIMSTWFGSQILIYYTENKLKLWRGERVIGYVNY